MRFTLEFMSIILIKLQILQSLSETTSNIGNWTSSIFNNLNISNHKID